MVEKKIFSNMLIEIQATEESLAQNLYRSSDPTRKAANGNTLRQERKILRWPIKLFKEII
jgi:hypothetical protein